MNSHGREGVLPIPPQALKAFEGAIDEVDIPDLTAQMISDRSLPVLRTHAWIAADEFMATEFDPSMILEGLNISNRASFVRLVNNAATHFAEYTAGQTAACARLMCNVRNAFRHFVINVVRSALNGQSSFDEGFQDNFDNGASQALDRLLFQLDFLEPEQLALYDSRLTASDDRVISAAVELTRCAEEQNRLLMQDMAAARLNVVTSPDYVSRVELEYFDVSYEDAFYSLEPILGPIAIQAIKSIEADVWPTE